MRSFLLTRRMRDRTTTPRWPRDETNYVRRRADRTVYILLDYTGRPLIVTRRDSIEVVHIVRAGMQLTLTRWPRLE
jgi:hypothetical protein